MNRILIVFVGLLGFACGKPEPPVTVFENGVIYTMVNKSPVVYAMAIAGDEIVAIGDAALAMKPSAAQIIDLNGKTVIPGLIDSHCHMSGLGEFLQNLNAMGSTSVEDIQEKVARHADLNPQLTWIQGRGWDQNLWTTKQFPTAADLDRVVADRPVKLDRVDGHAIWVNTRAMELAGISADTPDPDGGKIIRDKNGQPTGVFIDNAEKLITDVIPLYTDEEVLTQIKLAMTEVNKYGLTGVHDAGTSLQEITLLKDHLNADWYSVRWVAMLDGNRSAWKQYKKSGPEIGLGNGRLFIRSLKLYADGALGSRGAWMMAPYADDPSNDGLAVTSVDSLLIFTTEANAAGFQVGIHAIGDRANHEVLSIFQQVIGQSGRDHRHRIEHAQILALSDVNRFKELGVIAAMQPTHATSDMPWAEDRVGPARIKGGYVWRSLIDSGAHVAFGSDFPVEQVNPFLGIYAAVTRQDTTGQPVDGWYSGERVTRVEAVKGFTTWAAYAGFMEDDVGQLQPGFLADFIIIDRDIFQVPDPRDIARTQVLETWFGGRKIGF